MPTTTSTESHINKYVINIDFSESVEAIDTIEPFLMIIIVLIAIIVIVKLIKVIKLGYKKHNESIIKKHDKCPHIITAKMTNKIPTE